MSVRQCKFAIPAGTFLRDPYADSYKSEENETLYGFAILVDKDNTLGQNALIDAEKWMTLLSDKTLGEGTYIIGAPDENGCVAPQMLLISDGDGSWQWPLERKKISDAYPGFNDWISNKGNTDWHTKPTTEYVTKK